MLLLGAAIGLAVVTKSTGMVAAGVLLALWWAARAYRSLRARAATAGAGVLRRVALALWRPSATALCVIAVALLIPGPFMIRMTVTYGSPLGSEGIREHGMQRHDPAAVAVNAARMLQLVTMVPDDRVNAKVAHAVKALADVLGENVVDPRTTRATSYPMYGYPGADEDLAPYPLQVAAVGAGLLYCLLLRRRDLLVLGYALACVATWLGYAACVKWQVFGNRLLLPGLVLGAPLAGLAAEAGMRRIRAARRRGMLVTGTALAMVTALAVEVVGVNAVLWGRPRPMLGTGSVLTATPGETRWARAPYYRRDYERAAEILRRAGARRIGMVANGGLFEYPWWVLLRGRRFVNIESSIPGHPAVDPSTLDAVVCFSPAPPSCTTLIPRGWRREERPFVVLALPPSNPVAASLRTPSR